KQAVAECWRNLSATGARPLACSDNLNFGNPEKPEIMGQLVGAIKGIGQACRALDFPIVSGNVSLYNETNGVGIPPTPTIAGVGLLDDYQIMARIAFSAPGQAIFLVGAPKDWGTHLSRSRYAQILHDRNEGPPPPVDLEKEQANGQFIRRAIREGITRTVHDCSDGGIAVALAEMCLAGDTGATITSAPGEKDTASLFGEDQGRYLIALPEENIVALERLAADIPVSECPVLVRIGTTGGQNLKLGQSRAISLAELRSAHEDWFPRFMDN
ncbi:MAG TPA: phosphoribosylformylglycinamidine synthase II, partial [Devosia sp.]|nr:phosphoribosylformylglycinamidine synthase II [Devosia sp.]